MEKISIVAFKNKKKTKAIHPDYTGISRDKNLAVAIWEKPGKQNPNENYLSIVVGPNTYKQKEQSDFD